MNTVTQLNIFSTGITCSHCNTDPFYGKNPVLWNGFKDADTGQFVCWKCREIHYNKKNNTAAAFQYSEMPVVIAQQIKS